jgi:curved DNA-binding protein CbpA
LTDTLLYDLLEVEPTASAAEIKTAHRQAAKRFHPDRGGDSARFVAITRAYSVLSDPDRRKRYDATGQFDADEADNSHADLIFTLSSVLNHVLSSSRLAIDSTDFVSEMRRLVAASRDVTAEELAAIEERLEALQAARARIRRKDEAENLFSTVIDGQIRKLTQARITKRNVLAAQERATEELERYDSMVDIIRSVQSGAAGTSSEPGA